MQIILKTKGGGKKKLLGIERTPSTLQPQHFAILCHIVIEIMTCSVVNYFKYMGLPPSFVDTQRLVDDQPKHNESSRMCLLCSSLLLSDRVPSRSVSFSAKGPWVGFKIYRERLFARGAKKIVL